MAILLKNGADPNQRNQKGETPLLLIFIEEENSEKLVMKAMSILLGCGADPMLRDISNNCPLYQAVRFPPIALKHMLQADLQLGEATRLSRERISDTNERTFWKNWELALRTEDWGQAKALLLDRRGSLRANIDKQIRQNALWVLVEKHLDMTKNMAYTNTTAVEGRRSRVATILRDCRQLGAHQVAAQYMDYLLELC